MKDEKTFSAKQKAEKIAITLLYPFLMLFNWIGKSIKLLNTKNKQIIASALCLALIVGMVPLATLTTNAISSDPGQDDDGYYQLGTVDDLTWFASQVNGGNNEINAKLTADIDFGSGNTTNWTPIGTSANKYNGTFDGQNNTVKNLYFNGTETPYESLFGYTNENAEIKNLGTYFNFTSSWTQSCYLSGICHFNYGTITNCHVTGILNNKKNNTYGICSSNYGTIKNCSNNSTITASYSASGICETNNGTITDCYNAGAVTSDIDGRSAGVCYNNDGKISGCYNTGNITGYIVGGICFDNSGTTTDCYNTGTITGGDNNSVNIGGIAGQNLRTITNCYNTGNVTGGVQSSIGGICGQNAYWGENSGCYGTITKCYNTGTVTNGTDSNSRVNGICGLNSNTEGQNIDNGAITHCYYKDNSETDIISGTTFKTTNEFASGDVCYLLNGDQSEISFYQTLETDSLPVLDSTHKIVYKDGDNYTNTKPKTYTVAGSGGLCESNWDPGNSDNDMTKASDSGVYTITYTNVNVGDYEFKIVQDHSWGTSWGDPTTASGCVLAKVATNGSTVTITFTLATEKIDVKVAAPTGVLTKDYFQYTAPAKLTYDGKEKKAKVISNTDVTCGKITVKYYQGDTLLTSAPVDAGTYTVKIDVAKNKNYNAITDLVIDSFTIGQKELKPGGITLSNITEQYYTSKQITPDFTVSNGDTVLVKDKDYTVVYGENTNVGKQIGTIDVTLCGNYSGSTSKKFDIVYRPLPEDKNAFTIPAPTGENDWYNADFFVTANEGYLVSEDLPSTSDIKDFAGKFKINYEYNNRKKNIYIKDNDGNYYIASFNYSLDKTAPTDPQIEYNNSGLKVFLNKVTFGLLFKNTVNVNATATDNLTENVKVEYYAADSEVTDTSTITAWTSSLSLTPNSKKIVYVKFTDDAGNYIIANDQGVIVYTDSEADTDSIEFTKTTTDNVTATVTLNGNTIKDIKNGDYTLIKDRAYTVNGNEITFTSSYLDILQAGDYTLTVSYNPMGEDDSSLDGDKPSTTEIALTVKKAEGSVTNISNLSKEYDKNAVSGLTFDNLGTGDITIEYKSADADNSEYSQTAPNQAGNYTVRVTAATDENYLEASATADFEISRRNVTIVGTTIDSEKIYDGNTTATITSVGTLSNKIPSDNVYYNVGKANYSDKNVGTAKEVTFTGYYISGIDSANYTLKGQPESITANITKKELTIDLSIKNKQYDGLNTAEFSKTPTLVGAIENDVVTLTNGTPTFSSVAVGTSLSINFTAFSISGTDANNYSLTEPTATAEIYNNYEANVGTDYTVNSNDWINTDFVVTAKDGYKVSLTDTADGEWEDTLEKSEETSNGGITFYVKNVSSGAISKDATESYKIDKTAPIITGIEDGAQYFTTQKATVSDDNVKSVTLNDNNVKENVTINGNVNETYVLTVTDEAGNATSYTITMKPIKTISQDIEKITDDNVMTSDKDDIAKVLKSAQDVDTKNATDEEKKELKEIIEKCEKLLDTIKTFSSVSDDESIKAVEDITKDSAKLSDKDELNKAKNTLEDALKDYNNNYNKEEKEALESRLKAVNDSLTAIDNAEKTIELITKLPAISNIELGDKANVEAAKDAYEKLTDAEKNLVSADLKNKLDDAMNTIKNLEKQAEDNSNQSPTTSDVKNAIPAISILITTGSLFAILFVVKKRKESK